MGAIGSAVGTGLGALAGGTAGAAAGNAAANGISNLVSGGKGKGKGKDGKGKGKEGKHGKGKGKRRSLNVEEERQLANLLAPLEAVLEELHLEMLSDQQPGVSLEGSLTSHLQARLLEVLPAPWLGELLVLALAMLPPMGSATSSQVAKGKGKEKEGRAARVCSGSAKVA